MKQVLVRYRSFLENLVRLNNALIKKKKIPEKECVNIVAQSRLLNGKGTEGGHRDEKGTKCYYKKDLNAFDESRE